MNNMFKSVILVVNFILLTAHESQSQSVEFKVGNHWNIISVPLKVNDYQKSTLFPTAVSNAYFYQGFYLLADTLMNGIGYWLKFDSAQTINITGDTVNFVSINVVEGWNLIGSITIPIATDSIISNHPDLTVSNFFGYRNGYFITDTIQPGQGYWVKCRLSGKLILSFPTGPFPEENLITNSSFEENGTPSLEGWSNVSFDTTSVGFSTSVPPGGGSFSVSLKNEWMTPGTLLYTITPQAGTHQYQLSAWGTGGGDMSVLLRTGGSNVGLSSFDFNDTTWTFVIHHDTITTAVNDTILIMLRGNIGQFSSGYAFFDLCKFLKLN